MGTQSGRMIVGEILRIPHRYSPTLLGTTTTFTNWQTDQVAQITAEVCSLGSVVPSIRLHGEVAEWSMVPSKPLDCKKTCLHCDNNGYSQQEELS